MKKVRQHNDQKKKDQITQWPNEEGKKTQWPIEEGQKDKWTDKRSTKHHTENWRLNNTNPTKNGDEFKSRIDGVMVAAASAIDRGSERKSA